MFFSPALTRKPKTKESQVRSHERTEENQTKYLNLIPDTEEVADQEDLEAETSPDLMEGDIAISEVSVLRSLCRFVFTLNSDCQDLDPRLRLAVNFARYPTKKWPNNTVRYRISSNYS